MELLNENDIKNVSGGDGWDVAVLVDYREPWMNK